MNKFDRQIRKAAAAEKAAVPEAVHRSIEETLSGLPENNCRIHNISSFRRITGIAASFILVFFVLLPNLSPAYAEALQQVPVLGDIINVVLVRNYTYSENNYDMDIKVPEIQSGSGSGEYINKDINELSEALVSEFYKDMEPESKDGRGAVYLDYETVTDTPRWFTLKISVHEIRGGSNSYFRFYHIDRLKGRIINLGNLFSGEEGLKFITEEIKRQMEERMASDSELVFWSGEEEFSEGFSSISPEHNYFWDEKGNLVIPFDKYEVGPGSTGNPEFTIGREQLKPYLKDEYKNLWS